MASESSVKAMPADADPSPGLDTVQQHDQASASAADVAQPSDSASLSTQIQGAMGHQEERETDTSKASSSATPQEAVTQPADLVISADRDEREPQPLSATPRDPAVDQLHALFPDVDLEIIETVLAASGGSLDEATEQLLILSDPNYKPDPVELQQLEADEELARQLAQEDEAAAAEQRRRRAAAAAAQSQTQGSNAAGGAEGLSRPLSYQPYVPKSRRNTGNSGMPALSPSISPSSTSWEPPARPNKQPQERNAETQTRDELAEIGEQLSKFAEQGKKTFSNLFSKVKEGVAKMDDAIVRSASPPSEYSAPPPLTRKETYSPFPSPSLASAGPSSSAPLAQPARTTISVVPDRLPRPDSYTSTRSVSPQPPAPSAASPAHAGPDSADRSSTASPSTLKPVAKVPGFLPRQSFSLLDADKSKSSSTSGTTDAVKGSTLHQPEDANESTADGKRPRKESSGLLSAPNHRLEDSDDDELEYSRSPFEDDD
ncbi:hypothetical protein JCM10908_004245 [Rhodotorula pacifica]|uniref:ubiquitin-binding protein CUE5 n=1 Tax=Rhodotorula pacifica TaxID=1495444 RepID=UPI003176523C